MIRKSGVEFDSGVHSDLSAIMNEFSEQVYQENPDGFRRICWDQQFEVFERQRS